MQLLKTSQSKLCCLNVVLNPQFSVRGFIHFFDLGKLGASPAQHHAAPQGAPATLGLGVASSPISIHPDNKDRRKDKKGQVLFPRLLSHNAH